jgi:hypothetical protein
MPTVVPLSRGQRAIVSDEDAERVLALRWHAVPATSASGWYARNTKGVYLHRFLLNPKGKMVVDHVDGDGLNNVRSNIRLATNSQNLANRPHRSGTGLRGVYKCGVKYRAHNSVDGIEKKGRTWSNPIFAAYDYDRSAWAAFREFARLNFPCINHADLSHKDASQ